MQESVYFVFFFVFFLSLKLNLLLFTKMQESVYFVFRFRFFSLLGPAIIQAFTINMNTGVVLPTNFRVATPQESYFFLLSVSKFADSCVAFRVV